MRTTVVYKCKAALRRRDGDLKLVEHVAGSCVGVLELSGGLRWVHCRVFVNPSISDENVCQESHSHCVWVERCWLHRTVSLAKRDWFVRARWRGQAL